MIFTNCDLFGLTTSHNVNYLFHVKQNTGNPVMRKPQPSNVLTFPPRASGRALSFPRRTLAPIPGPMTCLVLVKHGETEKALLVSDHGEGMKAVWFPKSMLIIDPASKGTFLVATMAKHFAEQKGLSPFAFLDPESGIWSAQQVEEMNAAKVLAARNRNRLRNYREPMGYMGRNYFA